MAVPKKRTGASAQGHRRSKWKASKPETTTCPKCGAVVLTHTVCTACGYYKGKPASIKHADYATLAENADKPAKKTTKTKVSSTKKTVKKTEVATDIKEAIEPVETVETTTETKVEEKIKEEKVEEKKDVE